MQNAHISRSIWYQTVAAASVQRKRRFGRLKEEPSAVGVRPIAGRFKVGPNVVGVVHCSLKHKPHLPSFSQPLTISSSMPAAEQEPQATKRAAVAPQARRVASGTGSWGIRPLAARKGPNALTRTKLASLGRPVETAKSWIWGNQRDRCGSDACSGRQLRMT
jgi:hypothetical protein